jgi:hypothetical protein
MRYLARIGLPLAALVVAFSVTSTFAGLTYKKVGRAPLSSSSGLEGEMFVRQLANSRSHVAMRVSGLTPNSQPVWHLYTNDMCLSVGTRVADGAFPTVSPNGVSLTIVPELTGISVGSPSPHFYAVRVYDASGGQELACGRLVDLPDEPGGSQHWW